MERVVAGLQWQTLLVYLDDVIVYGKTMTEEIGRLREVFTRFRKANLKLKPSKCFLFQQAVKYQDMWYRKTALPPIQRKLKQ